MGSLSPPFNLRKIQCEAYVETGTGACTSLFEALRSRLFQQCYSIDIEPETVDFARKLLPMAKIYCGDSVTYLNLLLEEELQKYNSILFFLDAHFRGADYFGAPYDINAPHAIPLEQELTLIKKYRSSRKDIIICDDARIYSDAYAWQSGQNLLVPGEIEWLKKLYPNFHVFTENEGYFLIDNRF